MQQGELAQILQNIEEILLTNTSLFSDLESAQTEQDNYIERIVRLFRTHVS